jgi:hypothetical protein
MKKDHLAILILLVGLFLFGCGNGGYGDEVFENDDPASVDEEGSFEEHDTSTRPTSTSNTLELTEGQATLRDFRLPIPLFSPESAWNQSALDADVLPESEQQILTLYRVLLGDNSNLHPKNSDSSAPFMFVNYEEWTVPIFRAGAGQQMVLICTYDGDLDYTNPKLPEAAVEPGGPVMIPVATALIRPSGPEGAFSDGFLVLFDPDTVTAYDFWQATTQRDGECASHGGGLLGESVQEAGAVDFFDVRGPGANPTGYYSARASGLPLLGGLLLPEDVEAGVIAHALAVAIPYPRIANPRNPAPEDVIYPASSAEVDYYNTDAYALAQGQRIRLKDSLVLASEPWGDADGSEVMTLIDDLPVAPITRMFLTALHDYGAIVVDNDSSIGFYAEDVHSANLQLTDEQVNILIGNPPDTPLPAGLTKWQIVMGKLSEDLLIVPLGSGGDGPWWEYEGSARIAGKATIGVSNFEVVTPAATP